MGANDVEVFDFPVEQGDLSKGNLVHLLNQIKEPPRQPEIGHGLKHSMVYPAFLKVGDTLRPWVSMFKPINCWRVFFDS